MEAIRIINLIILIIDLILIIYHIKELKFEIKGLELENKYLRKELSNSIPIKEINRRMENSIIDMLTTPIIEYSGNEIKEEDIEKWSVEK